MLDLCFRSCWLQIDGIILVFLLVLRRGMTLSFTAPPPLPATGATHDLPRRLLQAGAPNKPRRGRELPNLAGSISNHIAKLWKTMFLLYLCNYLLICYMRLNLTVYSRVAGIRVLYLTAISHGRVMLDATFN